MSGRMKKEKRRKEVRKKREREKRENREKRKRREREEKENGQKRKREEEGEEEKEEQETLVYLIIKMGEGHLAKTSSDFSALPRSGISQLVARAETVMVAASETGPLSNINVGALR